MGYMILVDWPKDLIYEKYNEYLLNTTQVGECLIWNGWCSKQGYPRAQVNNEEFFVHQFIAQVHYEVWLLLTIRPFKLEACHICDTPPCIQPEHLIIATHSWNMKDAAKKGRMRYGAEPFRNGEDNLHAKLTEEQVKAIRLDKSRQADIAARFNISQPSVSSIKSGKRWSEST